MSKELPFFQFEPAQWMMGKIQRCSKSSKGAFVDLCARYWNNLCEYELDDARLDCGEDEINELLKNQVISELDGVISIDFLDIQLDKCAELSVKRKKAANIRWEAKGKQVDASALQVHKDAVQTDADKIREDDIREDNKIEEESIEDYSKEFLEIKKEFLKSDVWIEQTAMHKKTNVLITREYMEHFIEQLWLQDDYHKGLKEIRQHFINWFKPEKQKDAIESW